MREGTVARRLGVDFGRVIQGAATVPDGPDTVFLSGGVEQAMLTPPSADAFEVLGRIVPLFEGTWVISKCGPRIEQRTRQWLAHHDFFRRTGIPSENVRFCRARADKAIHCAELGITHMIDDRIEVHEALRGLVPQLYWFGAQTQPPPEWVRAVPTWLEAEAAIVGSGE